MKLVFSHQIKRDLNFFLSNKFTFNVYIHVDYVVLKVWSVKWSQITKFKLKIYPLEPQINPCQW